MLSSRSSIAMLLAMAGASLADMCGRPSLESWEGTCLKSGVGGWGTPEGDGFYIMEDGTRLEGSYQNGKPVGFGIFTWANGQRFIGYWENGKPHGNGTFTWKNGKRFEGSVIDGVPQGKGRLVWPGGEEYKGTFVNGKEDGRGLFVSSEGSYFCGEFRQGNGYGSVLVKFEDGSVYAGDWSNSSLTGRGVSYFRGNRYEGEFLEALPGGRGVMFTEKSVKYYGDWSQGARNGSGVYVWPDGSEYRGSFRAGVQHGCGVQVLPGILWGEELVKGLWVNGSQQQEGLSSCVQPGETDILALQSAEAAKESAQEARRRLEEAFEIARTIPECAIMNLSGSVENTFPAVSTFVFTERHLIAAALFVTCLTSIACLYLIVAPTSPHGQHDKQPEKTKSKGEVKDNKGSKKEKNN
ncbi:hypothetical protein GUITHDRAFT_154136 [Guillardia theta CCMP2712]|uniref:MORN repeat protein n=1 Tax=Guillardia theta (strain CCMP2712) TaxID=905079 RepID=L1IW29_GUITC|nr:hypothetical protein GUITHDRAFT_154136 [Guillardia theta CCMP2712]EKX40468.1 hypothetical protein GUITHDRAFT_154136 [Guillardia theta CCMP2712]|eukprot:XP_005827448.1 hypothetical protein GUITHDRAFT_154136 [Guillardia theta CCMP2712]